MLICADWSDAELAEELPARNEPQTLRIENAQRTLGHLFRQVRSSVCMAVAENADCQPDQFYEELDEMETMDVYVNGPHLKTWSYYIQQCNKDRRLTESERGKAISALKFLEKELGQDFLEYAYERRQELQHELFYCLVSKQWAYIAWLAEALLQLKNQDPTHNNYESLLRPIKLHRNFFSAVDVLENAYKFYRAGFRITIEPPVVVRNTEKHPDLKLIDNTSNTGLIVEISTVGSSQRFNNRAAYINERLARIELPLSIEEQKRNIHYSGHIYQHESFTDTDLDKIVDEVEKKIDQVKQGGLLQELIKKDVLEDKAIEIAIASQKDYGSLEKWASRRGFTIGPITGPPMFDEDEFKREIRRTRGTIRKKLTQLSSNYPCGLVVKNSSLFWLPHTDQVKRELLEVLDNNDHLVFLVLEGRLEFIPDTLDAKDCDIHERPDKKFDCSLVLLNQNCKFKINENTVSKIKKAFSYSWWFV